MYQFNSLYWKRDPSQFKTLPFGHSKKKGFKLFHELLFSMSLRNYGKSVEARLKRGTAVMEAEVTSCRVGWEQAASCHFRVSKSACPHQAQRSQDVSGSRWGPVRLSGRLPCPTQVNLTLTLTQFRPQRGQTTADTSRKQRIKGRLRCLEHGFASSLCIHT